MATETLRDVTFDSVLRVLMPPGERCYLRCAVGPERDQPEKFYMRRGNHWAACDQSGGSVEDFCISHGARGMKFSPIAWSSYATGSPMLACWALWASVAGEPSNGAKPTFTVDEGDRLVSVWLLKTPVIDIAHLKGLLERLRRVHGGDPSLADPSSALIGIPGSKSPNAIPAKTVAVISWNPEKTYELGKVVPS